MKAKIIDPRVKIYSDKDANSLSVGELVAGNVVDIGSVSKKDGRDWVEITLSTGQRGYLAGDTKIYHLKPVILLQGKVNVVSEPCAQSSVRGQYNKNDKFYLAGVVKQDDKDWVQVRDITSGSEGFIDPGTRIKVIAETTKAQGKRNIIVGGLWLIGGLIVTVGSYTAASSSGGTYWVAWGAILFGGIQFFQGLYQYITAPA